jgi:hypothetical protein
MALVYNPTATGTDPNKRKNELLHNASAPPTFPMQQTPDQTIPVVQPKTPLQPIQPLAATAPPTTTAPPPLPKAPTFSPEQAAALAGVQPLTAPLTDGAPPPAIAPAEPSPVMGPGIQPPPPVTPADIAPVSGQYTPEQLYQQLLESGYLSAIEGFQTPTTDMTGALTQQLLADPQMGRNFQKYGQQQMSQFDLDAAQAFEKSRQAAAPTSYAGETEADLRDLALGLGHERTRFGADVEQRQYETMRENLMQTLSAGRDMSDTERADFLAQIGSLTGMIGAGEGQEQRRFLATENAINRGMELAINSGNQAFQFALTELQGKIQQGIELTKLDFQSAQSELDRELRRTLQGTDIEAQREALQTQLDFNKAMQEAGFEFTASESALDRGLEVSLQTGDQEFQEKMMNMKEKIDLNLMMTQNDWSEIQNDLDRQLQKAIAEGDWAAREKILNMQQEFQGAQNEMDRIHDENMQTMTFEHDEWKQGRIEELTKLGWDHDTAMQQSDQEHQLFMQDFEWMKKELMQEGMEEHEADMMSQNYGYQMQMQSLDHQLQKEIESGRLDIELKKLAQDASQFTDELEFKEWAAQQGFDLEEQKMAWQSSENSLDRAHESLMLQLAQDFQREGLNLQMIMSQLENMPPDQAAEMLKQMSIDAGMTYQGDVNFHEKLIEVAEKYKGGDKDGWLEEAEATGISKEDAEEIWHYVLNPGKKPPDKDISITKDGLKPSGTGMQQQMQDELKMNNILAKIDEGQQLTKEDYDFYKDQPVHKPMQYEDLSKLFTYTYDARGSSSGYRAWRFKDDVWGWLNSNEGKVFKAENGELYRIVSFWEPGKEHDDKLKKAFVTIESVEDGSTFKWDGGSIGG